MPVGLEFYLSSCETCKQDPRVLNLIVRDVLVGTFASGTRGITNQLEKSAVAFYCSSVLWFSKSWREV